MNWKERCKEFGLDAPESFWNAPDCDIESSYNGAGPDNLPQAVAAWLKSIGVGNVDALAREMRRWLTEILEEFETAFVIHDWDFTVALDKSDDAFHAVNQRLLANMRKIVNARYPVWKFWQWHKREALKLEAEIVFKACDSDAGLEAWRD